MDANEGYAVFKVQINIYGMLTFSKTEQPQWHILSLQTQPANYLNKELFQIKGLKTKSKGSLFCRKSIFLEISGQYSVKQVPHDVFLHRKGFVLWKL